MTEKDRMETPKSVNQRKTLGMRRSVTKSASGRFHSPLPSTSKIEKLTESVQMLAKSAPPALRTEKSTPRDGLPSTPVNSKRHKLVNASKRLNLMESPSCEESPKSAETIDEKIQRLTNEIERKKAMIDTVEKHKIEMTNIKDCIKTWSEGGVRALELLQEKLEPRQEIESILHHLSIPSNIFNID